MKGTFESEYAMLTEWFLKAVAEADEKVKQLPYSGGLDSRASRITHPVHQERNRRLVALKVKYGKPLDKKEEGIYRRDRPNGEGP